MLAYLDDVVSNTISTSTAAAGRPHLTAGPGRRALRVDPLPYVLVIVSYHALPQELVGLISLLDPPRPDSAETIKRAQALGVEVRQTLKG